MRIVTSKNYVPLLWLATAAICSMVIPRSRLRGTMLQIRTRDDGYYRICGVPRKTLLLVRASAEQLMVTQAVTLDPEEIVRRLDLKLQP
ncbi:MAG: hypothetical protein ACJ796_07800 [Gemmatimonadaceae bacterium]